MWVQHSVPPMTKLFAKIGKQERKKLFSDISTVKNNQNENLSKFTVVFNRDQNLDPTTLALVGRTK